MIQFKVVPDGTDAYEVTATTRDIIRWETSGQGRSFSKLMDTMKLADLYELAYHASVRNGFFQGNVQAFKDSVDLEFETEDQDPTNEDH